MILIERLLNLLMCTTEHCILQLSQFGQHAVRLTSRRPSRWVAGHAANNAI